MQKAECRMQNGAPGDACVFGERKHCPKKQDFPSRKMMRKKARADAVAIVVVILAVLAVTSFVRAADTEYTTTEVVVQPGDTLWGIWEEMGYGRFDAWHVQVKKLNDKELSVLQPYERLIVPVMKGE